MRILLAVLLITPALASSQSIEKALAHEILQGMRPATEAYAYFESLRPSPKIEVQFVSENAAPALFWRRSLNQNEEPTLERIVIRLSTQQTEEIQKEVMRYMGKNALGAVKRTALFLAAEGAAQLEKARTLYENKIPEPGTAREAACFKKIYSAEAGCLSQGPMGLMPAEGKRWREISPEKTKQSALQFHLEIAEAFEKAEKPEGLYDAPKSLRRAALIALQDKKNEALLRQHEQASRLLFERIRKEWARHSNPRRRLESVYALSKLEIPEADKLTVLEIWINNKEEDSAVRRETLAVLAAMKNPKAEILLLHALENGSAYIRWHAAKMLAEKKSGSEPVLRALSKALSDRSLVEARTSGKFTAVGEEAGMALGAIGKTAAPACVEQLEKSTDSYVHRHAILALGEMGPEAGAAAGEALRKKANQGSDYTVIALALGALGNMGKTAIPALSKLLDAKSDNVRKSAILSLAAIRSPESAAGLIKALNDENWYNREIAIQHLGYFEGDAKEAILALEAMLKNDKGHGLKDKIQAALRRIRQ